MLSSKEIEHEFHDEIALMDNTQLHVLHGFVNDGYFYREAGEEFVRAVNEVCEERGKKW